METETRQKDSGTLDKNLLYVQVEQSMEDLLVRGRYKAGDRIPPEADLVQSLGVSRATVRAGLARLVERGLLERRQGSGTFLVKPPDGARLRNGLERLESYTVHAERLGLDLDSRELSIEATLAETEEAEALEVPRGEPLAKVCRTLLVNGEPAAWMVDVVPEDLISTARVRDRFRPEAMLLDLLVSEKVPIGFSKLCIDAELICPDDEVGSALGLKAPSAALSLIETMYLAGGRPAQWSRNVFLPGNLDLHVVRELFETRHLY
ncbi:GntR family transcriptional regulator [soil metagenome]|jgi:GntR family transcriptional regulator